VEAMPVLCYKTDNIYKDGTEMKRVWTEVCICLQEDFEDLRDVKKKKAVGEYCHNLLNTANLNSYERTFFHLTYPSVHILDICQGIAPA
jgi:hypothetical protein